MGHRNHQRARVGQARALDRNLQPVDEGQAVGGIGQLERQQPRAALEQLVGLGVLRVRGQKRVVHPRHGGVLRQKLRQRQRSVAAGPLAQGQGFGPGGNLVRLLGRQGTAHVAQAFFADLHQAPLAGITLAVGRKDVGVTSPVEQPGVGHGPAQRRAVATNGFGERVDHQAGTHGLGLEQRGRGDGVVHHVHQPVLAAKLADAVQIGHLGAGVGHGFHKHHAGVGLQGGGHGAGLGGIDQRDVNAQPPQRAHHAVGVAEHELADHQVVARLQQREKHRADGGHAGGKANGAQPAFQQVDARLQRRRGGRALAGVVVAFDGALEHADQLFHGVKTVLHRGVNGFAHAPVLHAEAAVGMDEAGVDACV